MAGGRTGPHLRAMSASAQSSPSPCAARAAAAAGLRARPRARLAGAGAALLCALAPTAARAQAPDAVRAAAAAEASAERRAAVAADVRRAYADGALLWHDAAGRATPAAQALARALADADARGIPAAALDAQPGGAVARAMAAAPAGDAGARARRDALLTARALRLAHALRFGRVAPTAVHAALRLPRDTADLVAVVRAMAAGGADATGARLDALEPSWAHYRALRAAYARYRALAADPDAAPVAPARTLRPGDTATVVPAMRRALAHLGDLADTVAASGGDSLRYDAALDAAVRRFQRRQGQAADGVIGPATRARLARPFGARVRQLALALERWRWLPRAFARPPIVVNVPAFRLYAFTRPGSDRERDLLTMDVVVGDAYDHRTPVFTGAMRTVVFSPYWDIPPGITRKETLPAARRDLGYLQRQRLEIVSTASGAILPPTRASLDRVARGAARIRQRPGDDNALGRVKFLFPNEYAVYLHDTPAEAAFTRVRRDLSHGCIRLADPVALARHVLRDDPAWTDARIAEAMRGARPTTVTLAAPIPVLLVYQTVVVREDGTTFFHDDIYGHDRALERALAAAGGMPR